MEGFNISSFIKSPKQTPPLYLIMVLNCLVDFCFLYLVLHLIINTWNFGLLKTAKIAGHGQIRSKMDPFRECRYFQLFFIDFQLFNFLLRIIPVKIIQLSSLQKLILLTVIHIMFNMMIYICLIWWSIYVINICCIFHCVVIFFRQLYFLLVFYYLYFIH